MTILSLIIAPDPRLKTRSETIEKIDDDIRALAANMFETMYRERGIGLAAVQVGILKRLLIADVGWKENEGPGEQHVLINPEIIETSHEPHVYKEGCLSFPDLFADVERPGSVRVGYLDLQGQPREQVYTGLLATCIQHEIDHTNGITFVDHISPMRRDMFHRKLSKLKKQGAFDHDHSQCGHDHSHDHDHDHVHGEDCDHDHRL